jgi:hypothetical protein
MSFATIHQDLALVRRLGVVDQLNRSIELLDRGCDLTFPKQQKAVLPSRRDR